MKRLALLLILFAVPAQAWTRKPLFQVVPGSPFTGGGGGGGGSVTFPLLAPDGASTAPSYSFTNKPTAGMYISSAGAGGTFLRGPSASGADTAGGFLALDGGPGTGTGNGGSIFVRISPPSTTGSTLNTVQDAMNISGTNGAITLGLVDILGVPGNMSLQGPRRAAGVTDGAGGTAFNIFGSQGTGTGVGGDVRFFVAPPAAGSASTQNGNLEVIRLSGTTGDITLTGATPGGAARGRVLVTSSTWMQQAASRVRLSADYTNATASFTNTVLSVSVVTGRAYSFSLSAFFSDSTAADGAQFDFNGGSATSTNFRAHCIAANAAGAALVLTNAATTSIATAVQVALALTTQAWLNCSGTFEPSSTGTFIVRAAQTAHSAGTLTVNRGSYLWVEDMP